MRHLRVPNRDVEDTLVILRERDWLASGMRVFSQEGEHRLIPLDPGAPIEIPPPLDIYEIALLDGLTDSKIDSDWWNHLSSIVDKEVIEELSLIHI